MSYCRDHRCSHHVETNADGWADDVRLSDIEDRFTCTACGKLALTSGRFFRSDGRIGTAMWRDPGPLGYRGVEEPKSLPDGAGVAVVRRRQIYARRFESFLGATAAKGS